MSEKEALDALVRVWQLSQGALSPTVPDSWEGKSDFYAERLSEIAELVKPYVFADKPKPGPKA